MAFDPTNPTSTNPAVPKIISNAIAADPKLAGLFNAVTGTNDSTLATDFTTPDPIGDAVKDANYRESVGTALSAKDTSPSSPSSIPDPIKAAISAKANAPYATKPEPGDNSGNNDNVVDMSGMAAKPSVIPKAPVAPTPAGIAASSPDYPVPAEISNAAAQMAQDNEPLPVPAQIRAAINPAEGDLAESMGAESGAKPKLNKTTLQKVESALPAIFKTMGIVGGGLEAGFGPVGGPHPGAEMFQKALEAEAEHNIQNRQLNIAQQKADTDEAYRQQAVKQFGLVQIGTNPDGSPRYVQQKDAGRLEGTLATNASREGIAQVNADNRLDVQAMKNLIAQGKVTKVEDAIDQNGKLGKAGYNAQGKLVGFLDGALPSASLLPKSTATTQFMLDGDNNIQALPKTTSTAPIIPGAGKAVVNGLGNGRVNRPVAPPASNANAPVANGTAPNNISPANPAVNPPATTAPPKGAIVAKPVYGSNGQPLGGKGSKDAGYAYDPKTDATYYTTRDDAASQGFRNFNPATTKQVREDTQLNNQLGDVAQKVTRYEQSYAAMPPSDGNKMAYLLNSDKFKLGALGAEIPIDEINTFLKQHQLGTLSPEGVKTYNAYLQARESLSGYNKVLSGSARNNETQLHLLLEALPNPTQPSNVVQDGIGQFKENIHIAGNGLPVIPGTKSWREYIGGSRPNPSGNAGTSNGGAGGGKYLPWFTPVPQPPAGK